VLVPDGQKQISAADRCSQVTTQADAAAHTGTTRRARCGMRSRGRLNWADAVKPERQCGFWCKMQRADTGRAVVASGVRLDAVEVGEVLVRSVGRGGGGGGSR
jgi:hypothetical protein